MFIGGVPPTILQSIMTSYPLGTNIFDPILALLFVAVIKDDLDAASSISGGSSAIHKTILIMLLNFIIHMYNESTSN